MNTDETQVSSDSHGARYPHSLSRPPPPFIAATALNPTLNRCTLRAAEAILQALLAGAANKRWYTNFDGAHQHLIKKTVFYLLSNGRWWQRAYSHDFPKRHNNSMFKIHHTIRAQYPFHIQPPATKAKAVPQRIRKTTSSSKLPSCGIDRPAFDSKGFHPASPYAVRRLVDTRHRRNYCGSPGEKKSGWEGADVAVQILLNPKSRVILR